MISTCLGDFKLSLGSSESYNIRHCTGGAATVVPIGSVDLIDPIFIAASSLIKRHECASLSFVINHYSIGLKICHHHNSHKTPTMPSGNRWGPWRSLLVLSPILICAPFFAYHQHHSELPAWIFCASELIARTL